MTITMYGIPGCDTIKSEKVWLDRNLSYEFHDFRKQGISSRDGRGILSSSSVGNKY